LIGRRDQSPSQEPSAPESEVKNNNMLKRIQTWTAAKTLPQHLADRLIAGLVKQGKPYSAEPNDDGTVTVSFSITVLS
jgi:hypothetical protein